MAGELSTRGRIGALVCGGAVLAAIVSWLHAPAETGRSTAGPPPTVVLVIVDTLRADHLGCYGGKAARTPTIDALAARGVRFEQACCATPLTRPAISTIMTGRLPRRHGVRDNVGVPLPADVPTLAEAFQTAGWNTAAFVSGQPVDRTSGLDRGFDTYDDRLGAGSGRGYGYAYGARPYGVPDPTAPGYGAYGAYGASVTLRERRAEDTIAAAVGWIQDQRDAPVFLWLHLFDPHQPYAPPPAEAERYAGSPYAGEVAYVDRALGAFFDGLAAAGRTEAVVCFTADHGEGLGEHGEDTHGHFLYDTTVRVPLLVAGPGIPAGRTVPRLARHQDLAVTLARLAAVAPPNGQDGADLAPAWRDGAIGRGEPAYLESLFDALRYGWAPLEGVRTRDAKWIAAPTPEAYRLDADPHEKHNMAATRELATELTVELERIRPSARTAAAPDGDAANPYGAALVTPRTAPEARNPLASAHLIRMFDRGVLAAGRRQFDAALTEFEGVLAEDPENPFAALWVAHVLRHQQAYTRALDAYERLDARLPAPQKDIWRGLAVCLRKLGRRPDAEERLRRIAGRWPRDPWPHIQLAEIRADLGNHAGAALAYTAALERAPRDARVAANCGLALINSGRAPEGAAQLCNALRWAPRDGRIRTLVRSAADALAADHHPASQGAARTLTAAIDALPPLGAGR